MADFLDQDEIDALLDICEDGDIVGAENIGIITLKGTSTNELQEVSMGSQGVVIIERNGFGHSREVKDVTVIAINKSKDIAIVLDNNFNPTKVNVAELTNGFYKTKDRIGAIETREIFDNISKKLNETVGIEFNDLIVAVKASKEAYPEVWL